MRAFELQPRDKKVCGALVSSDLILIFGKCFFFFFGLNALKIAAVLIVFGFVSICRLLTVSCSVPLKFLVNRNTKKQGFDTNDAQQKFENNSTILIFFLGKDKHIQDTEVCQKSMLSGKIFLQSD